MRASVLLFALLALQAPGLPVSRSYSSVALVPAPTRPRPLTAADFPATLGSCQVHRVPLVPTNVPIGYGHAFRFPPTPEEEAFEYAASVLFPNVPHVRSTGSCMTGPDDPEIEVQFVCPKCLEARREHLKHPPKH